MKRIRERIDKQLMVAMWMADNCIELLRDEEEEISNPELERYRRFKAFQYVASKLNPTVRFEDVRLNEILKKLAQLYPQYYFEVIRKDRVKPLRRFEDVGN